MNNNGTLFINKKIEDVTAKEISELYPEGHINVLVGCAPCQPYSSYTKNKQDKGKKWRLLSEFADLICEVEPDIVSMENVPDLVTFRKGTVYNAFFDHIRRKS